jgi:ribonuclease III
MSERLRLLESALGYSFQNSSLLDGALTHSSAANERINRTARDNEQLEFLGDSVLGFIISDYLYRRFSKLTEGQLSKIRARLVSSASLYRIAVNLELGEFLHLGKGEEKTGGRRKRALLANALEALVAAVYLDGGTDAARDFVLRAFQEDFAAIEGGNFYFNDYKSQLQERLQALHLPPAEYLVVKETGPEHQKYFSVELRVQGTKLTEGHGENKKSAEQEAARLALQSALS